MKLHILFCFLVFVAAATFAVPTYGQQKQKVVIKSSSSSSSELELLEVWATTTTAAEALLGPCDDHGLTQKDRFDTGLNFYWGLNGKPKDWAQAVYCFDLALSDNDTDLRNAVPAEIQFTLGLVYMSGGHGVIQSGDKAMEFFTQSAEAGYARGQV